MASGARFTATFDLRFIDRGATGYVGALRKTEVAQQRVQAATTKAAQVAARSNGETGRQAQAASRAAVATGRLAGEQTGLAADMARAATATAHMNEGLIEQAQKLIATAQAADTADAAAQRLARDQMQSARALLQAAGASTRAAHAATQAAGASDRAARSEDRRADATERASRTTAAASRAAGGAVSRLRRMAGAALAAAGGYEAMQAAMARESARARLQGQLGLSARDARRAGKVAADLYAAAWGDSMEGVAESTRSVVANLSEIGPRSGDLKAITRDVLALQTAFDEGADSITKTANALVANDLAADTRAALDIITRGFQQGADRSGEWLDSLNEYAEPIRSLGLDAREFGGLLVESGRRGVWSVDKVGDALKEFSIRAIDNSRRSREAFATLGLDPDAMGRDFAAGGDAARAALSQTVRQLAAMRDLVAQDAAGVALFGTMWEDIGPKVVTALDPAGRALRDTRGATRELVDALESDAGRRLEAFRRRALAALGDAAVRMLPAVEGIGAAVAPMAPVLATAADAVAEFAAAHPGLVQVAAAFVAVSAGVKAIQWAGQISGVTSLTRRLGELTRTATQAATATSAASAAGGAPAGARAGARAPPARSSRWGTAGLLSGGDPISGAIGGAALGATFGPWGMAIGAALGAAVPLIRKHWGSIRAAGDDAIRWTKQAWRDATSWIEGAWSDATDAIGDLWGKLPGPVRGAIESVVNIVRRQLRGIRLVFDGAVEAAKGVFKTVGAVFRGDWGEAWEGVRQIIGGALKAAAGLFLTATAPVREAASKLFGTIKGPAGDIVSWLGGLPGKIVAAISGGLSSLGSLGRSIVDAIISGIKASPNAVIDAVKSIVPGPLRSAVGKITDLNPFRHGGIVQRFASGGVVDTMMSPGELLRYPGGAWGAVPGEPVAADSVHLRVPAGTEVYTFSGQAMLAAGATRDQALAHQAPHFARGGRVITTGFTVFDDGEPGAWGSLRGGYAELGTAVGRRATGVGNLARQLGLPGELPVNTPALVTIGARSKLLKKRDRGFGQGGGDRAGGGGSNSRFTIDIWRDSWGALGLNASSSGTARVRVGGAAASATAPTRAGRSDDLSRMSARKLRRSMQTLTGPSVQDAFEQAYQARLDGTRLTRNMGTLVGDVASAARTKLEVQTDRGGGPSARAATRALPAGASVSARNARMVRTANAIDRQRLPYAWGGGHATIGRPSRGSRFAHGRGPIGTGYDCSGAVSAVLHGGGLLSSSMTSGGLMGWGKAGSGRSMEVKADRSHVIMRLGNRWWGTSESNPNGGAGWLAGNTMAGRGVARTWQGFRRGGTAARRRPGTGAAAAAGARGAVGGRFGAAFSKLFGAGNRDNERVTDALHALPALLARVERVSADRLAGLVAAMNRAIRSTASSRSAGGRSLTKTEAAMIRRARAVNSLAGAELGRRAGTHALRAERIGTRIDDTAANSDRMMRAGGVDPSSVTGLAHQGDVMEWTARQQSRRRGSLDRALGLALRAGRSGRSTAKALRDQIAQLDQDIAELGVRRIENVRDRVRAAAAAAVSNAQYGTDLANAAMTANDAQRNLAGVAGTPQGMRGQASDITGLLLPQLRAQQSALARQAADLWAIGDMEGWRQVDLAWRQMGADIVNATADAQRLIVEAAKAEAQRVVDTARYGTDVAQATMAGNDARRTLAGVAGTPQGMREQANEITALLLPSMQGQLAALAEQADALLRAGDVDGWRAVDIAMRQMATDIVSATADAQRLIREAASTEAGKLVSDADFALSVAQAQQVGFELSQRLAGTYEGGGADRAAFLTRSLIPALEAQIAADRAALDVERRTWGEDSEQFQRALLKLLNDQNALAQAQLDAQEAIRENTTPKSIGGTLAFQSGGDTYTDLVLMSNGV